MNQRDANEAVEAQKLGPLRARDVDDHIKQQAADDRSLLIRELVEAWKEDRDNERQLRKRYAYWLLGGMLAQVVAVNLAFFLIGAQVLVVDQWVANTFIVGVFSELAAMVFFIVKYLFAKEEKTIHHLGSDLFAMRSAASERSEQ